MIKAVQIDEYRRCDLATCRNKAVWEFTVRCRDRRPRRIFVCGEHQIEGFARARELA